DQLERQVAARHARVAEPQRAGRALADEQRRRLVILDVELRARVGTLGHDDREAARDGRRKARLELGGALLQIRGIVPYHAGTISRTLDGAAAAVASGSQREVGQQVDDVVAAEVAGPAE